MRKSMVNTYFYSSEKLYATNIYDENPILDAVIKQCPTLKEEIHNPYGKLLSGNEILDIICDGRCEEPKSYGTVS